MTGNAGSTGPRHSITESSFASKSHASCTRLPDDLQRSKAVLRRAARAFAAPERAGRIRRIFATSGASGGKAANPRTTGSDRQVPPAAVGRLAGPARAPRRAGPTGLRTD